MDGTGFPQADRDAPPAAGGQAARHSLPTRLEARGLSWCPANGSSILTDVSFEVEPGTIMAVVGANGAGKSTLLRLVYRYYRPLCGQILLDGQDIWKLSSRQVAREMAVVLQERPTEFSMTVSEVVALGRLPHGKQPGRDRQSNGWIVERSMARLGVSDLRDRLLRTLSGGEIQRVAIARALAQDPGILVLDEPTNHLDIRHQLETLSLLKELGLTVICSLHDINLASDHADRILVLAQGRMLACGTPGEVLSPELISAAFSVTARLDRVVGNERQRFSFEL